MFPDPGSTEPAGPAPGVADEPPSASAAPAPSELRLYRAPLHDGGPELEIRVLGEPAGGGQEHAVRALELRRTGEPEPFQVLAGLEDTLVLAEGREGVELLDLDFDGWADLRVLAEAPPGPNVTWRHWLYDPATEIFLPSPALDALPSPRPDPESQRLVSTWRDGATRYGTDFYEMAGRQPRLVRREVKEYTEPGAYRLEISERVDGRMQVTRRETVRE